MDVVNKIIEGHLVCAIQGKEVDKAEITYQKGREPRVKITCKLPLIY